MIKISEAGRRLVRAAVFRMDGLDREQRELAELTASIGGLSDDELAEVQRVFQETPLTLQEAVQRVARRRYAGRPRWLR